MNEEVIIDGLTTEDFILLSDILKKTQIAAFDHDRFIRVNALLSKIGQIVDELSK